MKMRIAMSKTIKEQKKWETNKFDAILRGDLQINELIKPNETMTPNYRTFQKLSPLYLLVSFDGGKMLQQKKKHREKKETTNSSKKRMSNQCNKKVEIANKSRMNAPSIIERTFANDGAMTQR